MNTEEIAKKFVEIYRSSDPMKKYDLYSEDCVSVESPVYGMRQEFKGLSDIKSRHHEFYSQFSEIHNKHVTEPLIGDTGFSVVINFDVTKDGIVTKMNELCVFQVKAGKIIRQEFIY